MVPSYKILKDSRLEILLVFIDSNFKSHVLVCQKLYVLGTYYIANRNEMWSQQLGVHKADKISNCPYNRKSSLELILAYLRIMFTM